MLKLSGPIEVIAPARGVQSALLTITTDPHLPGPIRSRFALFSEQLVSAEGYGAQLACALDSAQGVTPGGDAPLYRVPSHFNYLRDGDIIFLDATRGFLQTLFRKNSAHNSILLTEQCNHYCLMCSQPPKKADDSHLLRRAFELISLIPADTGRIGFTGGEPTLYGQDLIDLVRHVKRQLPRTSLDILTNGRRFRDLVFAKEFAAAQHPDCLLGIPIYSDDPVRHNYVVQAAGAFDETIQGVLNLKRFGQKVEIRVVLHKQTIDRLVRTCEFLCRNLLFVDHVALMGLEITGFTRANLDLLWIDPHDYRDVLSEAVHVLNSYGMNTSVYNHQLCVVNGDLEANYRKSISDWKNEYLDACAPCVRKNDCGGFFSSSKMYKHSQYIQPFLACSV